MELATLKRWRYAIGLWCGFLAIGGFAVLMLALTPFTVRWYDLWPFGLVLPVWVLGWDAIADSWGW